MKDYDRDYGLPEGEVLGKPVATPLTGEGFEGCPNCGCEQLMEIKIPMKQELLKGGKGMGTYIGCPACPFASPMAIVAS